MEDLASQPACALDDVVLFWTQPVSQRLRLGFRLLAFLYPLRYQAILRCPFPEGYSGNATGLPRSAGIIVMGS